MLVIEPKKTLGIYARISGVVDNFQLNVLLMDGFPQSGLLARRRVPKRVADVARGDGPQQTEDTVTSVWNMYTWQAIGSDFTMPNRADYDSSQFWVWNEGTPEDIPVFDGRRVVLLGPASYPRSWQSQRMFDNLPATLKIDEAFPGRSTRLAMPYGGCERCELTTLTVSLTYRQDNGSFWIQSYTPKPQHRDCQSWARAGQSTDDFRSVGRQSTVLREARQPRGDLY